MRLGIVGLPNVGKSTLFNAITRAGAQSANYPFCTIEPNVGVVAVPDERLLVLSEMHSSEKVTPAVIEFVDIAGLVKGASGGEGLGNKFLSHIREVDAIVHVVRCFEDENITHVDGSVDPARDIETINLELIMADLESVERGILRSEKLAKQGGRDAATEVGALKKAEEFLKRGQPARAAGLTEDEKKAIRGFSLLTLKPVIFAANLGEGDFSEKGVSNEHYEGLCAIAQAEGAGVLPISAKIEEELSEIIDEEKAEYLRELGLSESGLMRLVKKSYELLGLISYLTSGEKETRAWTIKAGTKAPAAAGKIHGDFERGFIRAEVVAYADLVKAGSIAAAREKGILRSEGKEYVIKDGDVVLFRFNV